MSIEKNNGREIKPSEILHLLQSNDDQEIVRGIEMIPEVLCEHKEINSVLLGLAMFFPDKSVRNTVKKKLQKNLSAELLSAFTEQTEKTKNLEIAFNELKDHSLVDCLTFAETAYHFTKKDINPFGRTEILHLGGRYLEELVKKLKVRKASHIDFARLRSEFILHLPKWIREVHPDVRKFLPTDIDSIYVSNCWSESVCDLLSGLTGIKEALLRSDQELPESFRLWEGLEHLMLYIHSEKLPTSLTALKHLKELEIANDRLKILPAFLPDIPLERMMIHTPELRQIEKKSPGYAGLHKLELSGCYNLHITDTESPFPNLRHLIFSYVNFSNISSQALSSWCKDLEHLSVQSTGHVNISEFLTAMFLSGKDSLKTIRLDEISDMSIPETIRQCHKLEHLHLVGRGITSIPDLTGISLKTLLLETTLVKQLPDSVIAMNSLTLVSLPHGMKRFKTKLEKSVPGITVHSYPKL